jgi:serine/threonine protein kinase
MPNLTGQSIGRYHILEQLGEGGMATVYKAYDTRLERDVAVKMLRTDQFIPAQLDMVLQRFEREAKALAKLKHPNIVNILDFGEHEGRPYLVMEYLPGGTLKQKLGHAVPWQGAFQVLLPIARGLAYAHQHNLIHRDVKPANILVDENEEPILTDFGIAKLLEGAEGHTLTGTGVGLGTPEYMAPEQGMGASAIDARADIYSLGIVLYEMVTGRKPYVADTPMAVVLKQMTDPLPRPTDFVPGLPESVEKILFKALAKQPEDRYMDMNALIAAMEGLLASPQQVEASTAPVPTRQVEKKAAPRAKPSRKMVMVFSGMLGAIAIIVLGIMAAPVIGSYLSPAPTNTLSPTVTRTATPTLTPSATPTHTPRPKPTSTPDLRILNPANHHLYLYVKKEMSWHSARDYCASRGSHLVTIQDASENQYISQLVPGNIWLGATDDAKERTWVWITGEPWKFTNWASGEPNNINGNEDYLTLERFMTDPFWNDVDEASNILPLVCEWESAAP